MIFDIGLNTKVLPISFILLYSVILTYFVAKILKKAGFSGWLSLLSLIPIVNAICLWVFAYMDWPNENK